MGQSVSYLHNKINKDDLTKAVEKFQSDDADAPRFLVGTTQTIGKGLDLFKANVMVQWEVEWLIRDEAQARARVIRVGQTKPVLTYQFVCENSTVEYMTANRHKMRGHIIQEIEGNEQTQEESDVDDNNEESTAV